MPLSSDHADQIAELINRRNELTVPYTRQRVLKYGENYICRLSESGTVIACVEVKIVQWYQTEICHLSVDENHARQGHARALVEEAEKRAADHSARIAQCTIRDGNEASCRLFASLGYTQVSAFHNHRSGNKVWVLQKVLVKDAEMAG